MDGRRHSRFMMDVLQNMTTADNHSIHALELHIKVHLKAV